MVPPRLCEIELSGDSLVEETESSLFKVAMSRCITIMPTLLAFNWEDGGSESAMTKLAHAGQLPRGQDLDPV